ncbi:uncharacterized protein ARMOST_20493 [Armillaria ostoyae]|uniref:Secreted protein n=1 Tax=Armillaria ostoyae TaxID=47428 RepID=A0A284S7H3_ARMOS|nr:uncharacterized protein ARMOST_20493 [Armillaria ostoyae]
MIRHILESLLPFLLCTLIRDPLVFRRKSASREVVYPFLTQNHFTYYSVDTLTPVYLSKFVPILTANSRWICLQCSGTLGAN